MLNLNELYQQHGFKPVEMSETVASIENFIKTTQDSISKKIKKDLDLESIQDGSAEIIKQGKLKYKETEFFIILKENTPMEILEEISLSLYEDQKKLDEINASEEAIDAIKYHIIKRISDHAVEKCEKFITENCDENSYIIIGAKSHQNFRKHEKKYDLYFEIGIHLNEENINKEKYHFIRYANHQNDKPIEVSAIEKYKKLFYCPT